jgi:hypothetical protein
MSHFCVFFRFDRVVTAAAALLLRQQARYDLNPNRGSALGTLCDCICRSNHPFRSQTLGDRRRALKQSHSGWETAARDNLIGITVEGAPQPTSIRSWQDTHRIGQQHAQPTQIRRCTATHRVAACTFREMCDHPRKLVHE